MWGDMRRVQLVVEHTVRPLLRNDGNLALSRDREWNVTPYHSHTHSGNDQQGDILAVF